jgi:DNA-binding protein YbaB
MSMIDTMKKAKDLYMKNREMQKRLEAKRVEVVVNGVTVIANGKQEFISIKIADVVWAEGKERTERAILKACNESAEQTRKLMEQEAKTLMGGMSQTDMLNMLK